MATYKIIGGDGNEYGPVDADQLRAWMAEQRVGPDTLIQAEGSSDWSPLSQLPEFASAGPPAVPPPAAAPAPATPHLTEKVSAYLVPAILCTLFCCLPFGIPAIVFAAQVNSKLAAGDLAGARASSGKAKLWCWLSFGCGLFVALIYLVAIAVGMTRHSH